jgi:hypothetical protein
VYVAYRPYFSSTLRRDWRTGGGDDVYGFRAARAMSWALRRRFRSRDC